MSVYANHKNLLPGLRKVYELCVLLGYDLTPESVDLHRLLVKVMNKRYVTSCHMHLPLNVSCTVEDLRTIKAHIGTLEYNTDASEGIATLKNLYEAVDKAIEDVLAINTPHVYSIWDLHEDVEINAPPVLSARDRNLYRPTKK